LRADGSGPDLSLKRAEDGVAIAGEIIYDES